MPPGHSEVTTPTSQQYYDSAAAAAAAAAYTNAALVRIEVFGSQIHNTKILNVNPYLQIHHLPFQGTGYPGGDDYVAAAAAAASAYSQPLPFDAKADNGQNGNSSLRYPLGPSSRHPRGTRGASPGAGSSEGSSTSPNSPLQLTTNRYRCQKLIKRSYSLILCNLCFISSYENSGSGGVAYVSSVYDYSEQNGNHGNSFAKKV